jgi:hypothetical protein
VRQTAGLRVLARSLRYVPMQVVATSKQRARFGDELEIFARFAAPYRPNYESSVRLEKKPSNGSHLEPEKEKWPPIQVCLFY